MLVEGSKLLNAILLRESSDAVSQRNRQGFFICCYALHSRLQSTQRESMRVVEKSLRSIMFVDVEPSCTLLFIIHCERIYHVYASRQL
jgi:hypothetical protein